MASNPLRQCYSRWEQELHGDTDEHFVLSGILHGFTIMNIPDNLPKVECQNYSSATSGQNKLIIERQLKQEIALGHYKIAVSKPSIISAIGAVPKSNGVDLRIIHDCSRPLDKGINAYANPSKFSFETIDSAIAIAPKHAWMGKIDIKSAYRHVGLHPSQFTATGLKFQFSGDNHYTYLYDTRLMFGASEAVGIFNRITQSIVRMMRRRGYHSTVCYLDDFLIMETTQSRCREAMHVLTSLLSDLGFTINYDKVIYPTQRLSFLGIDIDMQQHKLFIPPAKLTQIRHAISYWLHKYKATKRQLQSIVGLIAWGAKCVRAIRPILRSIIDLQASLQHAHHRIRLPVAVKKDLAYFYNWCMLFNGVSFSQRDQPDTIVYTDASLQAGAAYHKQDFIYYSWSADFPGLTNQSIYLKELCAILLAFHRWSHCWNNMTVLIRTDNLPAVWAIKKGLTKHVLANLVLKEILWIAALCNITILITHIPSKENCIADALSRLDDNRFLVQAIRLLQSQGVHIDHPKFNWLNHMSVPSLYQFYFSLQM